MVPSDKQKPVIFLAFANDPGHYLRNLADEQRSIRNALEHAEQLGLCDYVERSNATADDIFDVFGSQVRRDRIAVFHYAGHANYYQLLLESVGRGVVPASASGLASFLGQQRGLQLVFLNGCSTQEHTDALLAANVSAVISTSQAIADDVAMVFAVRFYQGLATGASIERAYEEAKAAIRTLKGDNPRNAYLERQGQIVEDRWPWELYLRKGAEIVRQWNLPDQVDDPCFGLPPLPDGYLPDEPFRNLHWFTQQDANIFFGRGREIRELYDLVTKPDTAPVLLLYGQSGVGKSSILEAGVMPRLGNNYKICYLRRDKKLGLLGTLSQAFLPEACEKSLAAAWRAAEARLGKPLVVILDQVEEAYTRADQRLPDEMSTFMLSLESIFAAPTARPLGKLILTFRKERFPEVRQELKVRKLAHATCFWSGWIGKGSSNQ